MYFVYNLRLRQTKRKRWTMCKQYQKGKDIISSNLHEYLTSILHNNFSNFYEILGSCFYAFNQYIEFSVSPCTENNENNMSNVKPLKLIHTFALVGISNYTILNSTILSVLQFSRLIDILSENFLIMS